MFWFWIYVVLHIAMILINTVWCVVVFRLTSSLIWRTVIVSFMVAQVIALVMLQTPIGWVAYGPKTFLVSVIVWNNLALFCGFVAALGYGLVRGIRFLGGRWPRSSGHTDAPTQVPAPQEDTVRRREFIGACAALMPVALTTGWTALAMKQISGFRVRRMTLSIPTLPRALDGLTIAHVSDMHVGRITCGRVLRNLVATTNDLRTDLVVLTGDLINYELSDLPEAIALARQMQGRYGQWMIEGNHDLLVSSAHFRERVRSAGVPFLRNECALAEVRGYPVQFLGLSWSDARGRHLDEIIAGELRELVKQRQPDAFPIFLAHHPHAFDAAAREGLPLTLCGHTHGGQLMLDSQHGAGSILFRYWSGLYQNGPSQMVVSNGVGNMFPIRINAPAEVIHLTLRCADARG